MRTHFTMPKKSSAGLHCKHGPENTFILSSPLGHLELVCCPKGIHKLTLPPWESDTKFSPKPNEEVEILSQMYQDNGYTYKSALFTVQWLQTYFQNLQGLGALSTPPICHLLQSTMNGKKASFTDRIWNTLAQSVHTGTKVSYGQLAVMSGSTSRASRAVGQAMRNNPVMIIVPCHRVILSSGQMGNYSGGTKNPVKAWLLQHEGGYG